MLQFLAKVKTGPRSPKRRTESLASEIDKILPVVPTLDGYVVQQLSADEALRVLQQVRAPVLAE